jgi:hypothetical protein
MLARPVAQIGWARFAKQRAVIGSRVERFLALRNG